MASRVFPIGTPLTVVWHFSKPDGTTFDLSGYTYRVYYRTGNRQTEVNSTHLTAFGNMLTVVIPADMQYAPGEYSLKLVLYQNSSIFCTLVYNVAFVLSQQMSGDPTTETQSEGGNTVHLYTVAEFYMFSPVVPTVGNDGYWYVNGNKISDGNGEFIPSSHTVEYDPATNRIIIDRGRVNQQGQSIAQVITSLADALGIASQSHNTAEQDHARAETDHDNAGDDHTNAQSDHEAIQQLIEQYEPIVINGDVTNAPDEEDITSDTNGLLKFKDRGTIYGMGYVILRKDKTFAEQVTKTNTIYEIRYDFDLDEESVTIPTGCMLEFKGGSINNGTLVFADTKLSGKVMITTDIQGTINESRLNIEWFGAKDEEGFDVSEIIQKLVEFTRESNNEVYVPAGTWRIANPITFYHTGGPIVGESSKNSTIKAIADMDWMFKNEATGRTNYAVPVIRKITLDGGAKNQILIDNQFNSAFDSYAKGGVYFENYWYTFFNEVRFYDIAGIAFRADNIWNVNLYDIFIQRCKVGMYFDLPNGLSIKHCEFNTISDYAIMSPSGHTFTIGENIFEVIGKSAIHINGGGDCNITNNYFEECSREGVDVYNYSGSGNPTRVRTNIIISSRRNSYVDVFKNGGPSVNTVSVSNNSFQEDYNQTTSELNQCAIYCSGCASLLVSKNTINNLSWDIIGSVLNTGVNINNVTIKDNNHYTTSASGFVDKNEKWCNFNIYKNDGYGVIGDVVSDADLSPIMNENLAKYLHVFDTSLTAFQQIDETYLNKKVFQASSAITLALRYTDANNGGRVCPALPEGFYVIQYYRKTSSAWEKVIKVDYDPIVNISIASGAKFTMPAVYYLLKNTIDDSDREPFTTSASTLTQSNITYLTDTYVKFVGDDTYKGAYFKTLGSYDLIRNDGVITPSLYNSNGQILFDFDKGNPLVNTAFGNKKIGFDTFRNFQSWSKQLQASDSIRIKASSANMGKIDVFAVDDSYNYQFMELVIIHKGSQYKVDILNAKGSEMFGVSNVIKDGSDYYFYLTRTPSTYAAIHIEYASAQLSKDVNGLVRDTIIEEAEFTVVSEVPQSVTSISPFGTES